MLRSSFRRSVGTVLFVLSFILSGPVAAAGQDKKPAPVVVAPARLLSTQPPIELPGTVLPWAISKLAAEIDGQVEELLFQEGQFVKKGTLLIQQRTRPLELERELAVAEREQVAARLEELNAGTRPEVLEAARASLENARARLQLTQNELRRVQNLYEEKVLSLNEYDKARAEADAAQADFNEKKANLEESVAGPRKEDIKEEEANLSAAEAKIKLIEDKIDRASIRAPFDGIVTKKETEMGQWLEVGDPGATLIATNPVKVEVNLPQYHYTKVDLGDRARVSLESGQPASSLRGFKGKVIEKIQAGNVTSRTFPVRIQVDNPNGRIVPGMLVQVTLTPSKRKPKELLFVHKDALVRSPQESVVWVVRPDKDNVMNAFKVVVRPGQQVDSLVAVETDNKNELRPGDLVVVNGNERLRPGMKVNIIQQRE